MNLLPGLASNCDPSRLSFPSSASYQHQATSKLWRQISAFLLVRNAFMELTVLKILAHDILRDRQVA
jgi:hypothetical protein